MKDIENEESYEFNSYFSTYFMDTGKQNLRYNIESIRLWMQDHITFNKEIRDLSNLIYNENGMYGRIIDYICALPTLDKMVYGKGVKEGNKDKYKETLNKIQDSILTRDIIRSLAKNGTYFGYFESNGAQQIKGSYSSTDIEELTEINEGMNCTVINFPIDYCRIVGRKNSSYVMAFNLEYFDQFRSNGLTKKIIRYPKEVRDGWKAYQTNRSNNWLVLNNNKTIVTKVRANISEAWGRPLGLGAFLDILFEKEYINAKRDTVQEANSALIYQTYPEGDKGKSTLTQTQQTNQHNAVRDALFTRKKNGVNFLSVAAGTKLEKLKVDLDILSKITEEDLIKRISTSLAFASSALNGSDSNYSSQETNLKLISAEVYSWMDQIVSEYNKVINDNIIKDYRNPIKMEYLHITHLNKDEMKNNAKELYTHGKGSLKVWIAASGFNPDAYLSLMEEEMEEGLDEKFPIHQTAFTQTSGENTKPTENNPTNSNTIKTKSNNANNNPTPKN